MSFTAKIEPTVALIGNPVLVKVKTSAEDRIYMTVRRDDAIIYEAAAVPDKDGSCVFSISDLFSDAFPLSLPEDGRELFCVLPDSLLSYTVTIKGKNRSVILPGKCYPGGISKKLMRYLSDRETDIFTAKFCNPRTNFFLSGRTRDSLITMRENEIGYLYCIGMGWTLTISDLHGHNCELILPSDRQIYALNLPEIRQRFFEQGTLSAYFRVSVNNKVIAVIAITPGTPDAVVLMFRNSFGVYEKIELSGVTKLQPDLKKRDIIYRYDELTGDFTGMAVRGSYIPVLTVESGYRPIRELEFLQELFLSEEVYLVQEGERIRVLVSSTKMKYRKPLAEPQSVEVKITFCDEEQYNSGLPEYIDAILTNKASLPITADGKEIQVNKYFNNETI